MPQPTPEPGAATVVRAIGLLVLSTAVAVAAWRLQPAHGFTGSSPDAGIVTGCAWLAWAVVGYLALAVAVAALAHLPTVGGVVRGVALRLTPGLVRRAVDSAVTAGLVASLATTIHPMAATAATPPAAVAARGPGTVVVGSPLDWPGLPTITPGHPAAATPPSAKPPSAQRTHPQPPEPHRTPNVRLVSPAPRHDSAHTAVVVQPGDTLWSIAAGRLGPGASAARINAAWHAWYAANRAVIGPNPGLIQPGQRLVAPQSEIAGPGR